MPCCGSSPWPWGSFWSAFVHAVRNAVDHGLESAEEREQSGKQGSGRLDLRTYLEDEQFVIAISDDGRGIDWGRVADRARTLGLPHATQADLVDALFVEGLSTSLEVTEYSGRGVGLGAVRAACEERGGRVDVRSEPGQGTTFLFRFPKHAVMVKPEDLVRPVRPALRERVA
jgi:two-component system, chemotaxis family, sensor kinase CheA